MTNKPGAATIVKCSIGVIADLELSDVMRMGCAWKAPKGFIVAIGLVQCIRKRRCSSIVRCNKLCYGRHQ